MTGQAPPKKSEIIVQILVFTLRCFRCYGAAAVAQKLEFLRFLWTFSLFLSAITARSARWEWEWPARRAVPPGSGPSRFGFAVTDPVCADPARVVLDRIGGELGLRRGKAWPNQGIILWAIVGTVSAASAQRW